MSVDDLVRDRKFESAVVAIEVACQFLSIRFKCEFRNAAWDGFPAIRDRETRRFARDFRCYLDRSALRGTSQGIVDETRDDPSQLDWVAI
jgi:hypothetical protein